MRAKSSKRENRHNLVNEKLRRTSGKNKTQMKTQRWINTAGDLLAIQLGLQDCDENMVRRKLWWRQCWQRTDDDGSMTWKWRERRNNQSGKTKKWWKVGEEDTETKKETMMYKWRRLNNAEEMETNKWHGIEPMAKMERWRQNDHQNWLWIIGCKEAEMKLMHQNESSEDTARSSEQIKEGMAPNSEGWYKGPYTSRRTGDVKNMATVREKQCNIRGEKRGDCRISKTLQH